jgi:ATP-dependent helicase/nuclease subunit B
VLSPLTDIIRPMQAEFISLGRDELFARLKAGAAARVTVLTPNRRLSGALQGDFDLAQAASGLEAWETADILPFEAFVQRLWEDALYSDLAAGVPVLLSPAQEQALWEEAIHATRHAATLFSPAPAAAQCRQAWQLAHGWRLALDAAGAPNEDARAFLDWSSRYVRATREKRQTDSARLPDVVAPHLGHAALRKPATLALFGFDIVTPQMREFLEAIAAQGTGIVEASPPAQRAAVTRVELIDAKAEIDAAARWARSRLEEFSPFPLGEGRGEGKGPARIGIVVPDLATSRARVQRMFANVMRPDHLVAPEATALPFNISLGAALADFPLISDALRVIDLAGHETQFEHASCVIRSPFIAGAEAEMEARARLDARLRERCTPSVALESLVRLCASPKSPRTPYLLERLQRLAEFRKSDLFGAKNASEWAKAFSDALRIVGFPGERALDSGEHQTLDKWHELLAEFATLERVTGKMGFNAARERLRSMAREAIFQPEARDVPIQVMGVLESAGQEFDHLWVMGLTDEAWPLPARPNPFIPVRVQRAAGIPQADPLSSLELDRRITQGWMRCAREVVVSHPRMKDESELAPSPLVASIALSSVDNLALERYTTLRDAIRAAGTTETVRDAAAPMVAVTTQSGGTGLFKDQAACPFRAFAVRRLQSEPLETPRLGLDARDRGTLVHSMLAATWKSLGTRGRLVAASQAELGGILGACADEAIALMRRYRADALSGRYAQLERERLVRLAGEWLAVDRHREDFEVVAIEEKHAVTFGGITVNAKLDRMDELAAGGRAIIDYKTGACATSAWMGARPDEPQLPMYALGGSEDIAAVAFAVVKTGESRFKGISRAPNLMPGVCTIDKDRGNAAKKYRDWNQLVAGWRTELEATGRGFAQGDARVDPKRGATTCETCKQHMFCRIAEKAHFGVQGEGEAEDHD